MGDIRRKLNKRAQVWSLDLVIASIIFFIGIVVLFLYALNYMSETKVSLNELFYEGNLLGNLILSDDSFGILSEDEVNNSKLNDKYGTYEKCQDRKTEMSLKYDFYFNLNDTSYCDVPGNPENRIKITRITNFGGSVSKFEIFVYDG